jgi:hypothetical protein
LGIADWGLLKIDDWRLRLEFLLARMVQWRACAS